MISVIIPCYNGFQYMKKCLEALERQSEKNFEVVVVDDFSTDNSYNELIEYARNTTLDFKVIRNLKNMGPGKSREIGFNNSQGDYIAFCDCDDWYEENFLEEMLKLVRNQNADLAFCNHYSVKADKKTLVCSVDKMLTKNSKEEMLALSPMSLCRLLVKRDLFENVIFSDLYYGEDGIVVLQLILNSKKVAITTKGYYNYFTRSDSASLKPSRRAWTDSVKGFEFIKNKLEGYRDECEFLGVKNIIYASSLLGRKAGISPHEIKRCVKEFKKDFQDYHKNRYLKELGLAKRIYIYSVYYELYFICDILIWLHKKAH